MTQIINFNNKLFLEEKFKIFTPNKLKIEYDFNNEEKYLNIDNKLVLKIIKVEKIQKYSKDDIFEPKQYYQYGNEYEIIITYDDRQNSIMKEKAISINSNSNSNKSKMSEIERPISIESKSDNLSKEKDSINFEIYKEKQNQKQIKNDVKLLRKNLLNKNHIFEYNNSTLSTTFQINEEDKRKCNTCNQSNIIIELDSDSENESNIKGKEKLTCRTEEFSNIKKKKIFENINNALVNKKRKRSDEEKEIYINIDNRGIDFNKFDFINNETIIKKQNNYKNNNNKGKKKRNKRRKKKY